MSGIEPQAANNNLRKVTNISQHKLLFILDRVAANLLMSANNLARMPVVAYDCTFFLCLRFLHVK